jgi:hypothetical protein
MRCSQRAGQRERPADARRDIRTSARRAFVPRVSVGVE